MDLEGEHSRNKILKIHKSHRFMLAEGLISSIHTPTILYVAGFALLQLCALKLIPFAKYCPLQLGLGDEREAEHYAWSPQVVLWHGS